MTKPVEILYYGTNMKCPSIIHKPDSRHDFVFPRLVNLIDAAIISCYNKDNTGLMAKVNFWKSEKNMGL